MPQLSVYRKTVGQLYSESRDTKFVIPDYQRPYSWHQEKCETLWDDITNFHSNKENKKDKKEKEEEYFLGTIVVCKGEGRSTEVIDGQQRITSLLLLLRAFYEKLEDMTEDDDVIGLKSQIAPCIWEVHPVSKKVKDFKKIRIESKVATENDNKSFHRILEKGIKDLQSEKSLGRPRENLYQSNYRFFKDRCDDYAKRNPMEWQPLCVAILDRCIILPIECDNVGTALTIFSTLNDRGMPLSDPDIFKAYIYRGKESEKKKKAFADDWKELSETASEAKIELEYLFRYYSHWIRAEKKDRTKEIAIRKLYTEKCSDYLKGTKSDTLMKDLRLLLEFWSSVNSNESKIEVEGEGKELLSFEALKWLHCLKHYPNDYWKYITSVYWLKNRESRQFKANFPKFLRGIIAFLFVKFIENPSVNAIKDGIYDGCISVCHNGTLKIKTKVPKMDNGFSASIGNAKKYQIAKGLILLHTYQHRNQTMPISSDFQIEHIFPKKWQNTNYNGWSREDADEYLERFGNKVAIEKKLNIQAGNNYFGRKKEKYRDSQVAEVRALGGHKKDDWTKDDIEKREKRFTDTLLNFFKENLPSVK